ncbi:MAG TPA: IscS subfamily cysteine desulfurase [Candidatus Acidoferrales bacterium]|nr:IscS subfamily cysteine desulfurase [Candidatus Acidoferrales bacterium]
MKTPIYMDNHATTPVDPRVLEAMLPYFSERFGNPASRNHVFGWEAAAAVDEARAQVARLINARSPDEIVFTSGGTEADNLAIKGVAAAYKNKGDHIVTCAAEHKAVLDSCKSLERQGFRITYLPVDRFGLVDLDRLQAAIDEKTILISIMAANNEVGTIQPIGEIGRVAKSRGVLFHTDAVQAVGKIPIDVEALGVDLLSLSAHKIYGPKGIGALYVRRKDPPVRLQAIIDGGGHERGLRSGTLNVPGILGLGMACEIAARVMAEEQARLAELREELHRQICTHLDEVYLNGHPSQRLAGNLNLSFAHVEGESLLMALKEIAVSTGSACTTANLEPSHVLRAMGVPERLAHASLRFGLGRFNTAEEVEYTARRVVEEVTRLRKLSRAYHRPGSALLEREKT